MSTLRMISLPGVCVCVFLAEFQEVVNEYLEDDQFARCVCVCFRVCVCICLYLCILCVYVCVSVCYCTF